jgi:hypothetical protein
MTDASSYNTNFSLKHELRLLMLFKKSQKWEKNSSIDFFKLRFFRYVQISKKGNYGNFCNFQEHVNSQKSIFENL